MSVTIPLHRDHFPPTPRLIARAGGTEVHGFSYASGVEALVIQTPRGYVTVLPFMGQMIWDAVFDGVDLCMGNAFRQPLSATEIAQTYGCFAFHSGLLRNGVPGPQDNHAAHGEMPTARMDSATLILDDAAVTLCGEYEYVMGFGAHYMARPHVRLGAADTVVDMGMAVENLSAAPMDLMYMAHVNFAFVPGGRIHQPAPFTPDRTRVRRAVPAHVTPNPAYLALIDRLASDPAAMQVLDQPDQYDPEQVFYIDAPAVDAEGQTHLMLERPEGDGFVLSYAPVQFPRLVRWVLNGGDAQVAAFALPATCEPEGYNAEKAKGNVQLLAPGAEAVFTTRMGYVTAQDVPALAAMIAGLKG
ncbi:aldose 1-epimerase family protein [Paracoccus jiaweipingae]|uniref:aldose 1-epimerase family protein n=1 Tax=unclassified Paracoccus (in: a-proteobacteria) TaxID=2688777 RepID=UPI0037903FD4